MVISISMIQHEALYFKIKQEIKIHLILYAKLLVCMFEN